MAERGAAPAEMVRVRALTRGLRLLELLDRDGPASLQALKRASGLSKPTTLRLLRTLEDAGWAWRAIGDGLWRPRLRLTPVRDAAIRNVAFAELAAPYLEALRARVIWPSDIAVRRGGWMELLETSRRVSGLALNRDRLGHRIDLVRSAVGRAYLAFCGDDERERLLAKAAPGEAARDAVERTLRDVRRRGYATRDASYGGSDASIREFDDQLAAIAVPIRDGPRVIACINIVWPKRLAAERRIVSTCLPALVATAQALAGAVRDAQRG
jgi:IclR family mhp operon transcriptional activator